MLRAFAPVFTTSPPAMLKTAMPNPYDTPALREAWKEGWDAFHEEKPPPDEHLFDDPEEMTVYLEGTKAGRETSGEVLRETIPED